MHVLVLANEAQQAELLAVPATAGIRFEFVAAPGTTASPDACIDLLFENKPDRIAWLSSLKCPVVINSVSATLGDLGVDMIRINGWPGFIDKPVVEASAAGQDLRTKATALFEMMGRRVEWVPDIAGFVSGRVISSIVNEAFFALEESVSTEDEIDIAMKLGTNYPYGPFEWGRKIGWQAVFSLLEQLAVQQKRYEPSSLLKQRALA